MPWASERVRSPGGLRCRRRLAFLAVGGVLLGVYLFGSLVLPRDMDFLRQSHSGPGFLPVLISPAGYSGVFDLDVMRVLQDWTGDTTYPWREPSRTHVHPLSRLTVAPIAGAVQWIFGAPPLDALRVVIAASMAISALLTGWLALELAGGALLPGLAAALLCGLSFSSILLGTIPDHGSVSGLSTLVPLLYVSMRFERRFDWREAITWGLLGVFGLAFTISQIMHWVIALGVRLFYLWRDRERPARAGHLPRKLLAAIVLLATITVAALALQAHLYPDAAFTPENMSREEAFFRLDDLRNDPIAHARRLLVQFAGYSFAAPFPGYSDYLIKRIGFRFWSLSLENADLRTLDPLQIVLGAALIGLLASAVWSIKRTDRRFVAPLLSVLGQIGLHLAYGREYILYSPNWHGPVVAMLVAAAWRTFETHQRLFAALTVGLSIALAANNLTVLRRVYDELDFGLEPWRRDAVGRQLADGPWQDHKPAWPFKVPKAPPPG